MQHEKMTDEQIDAFCDGLARSGTEHGAQRAFFAWLAFHLDRYPLARWMFAVPNGGLRDKVTAARLKAEGVKAGVSDIFYPVPIQSTRHGSMTNYHGLFIEMKAGDGALSDEQALFTVEMLRQGYAVAVCWGWRSARMAFCDYTKGDAVHREYKQ